MVLGVCRRMLADAHDAEDAFQATFLVLVRKAGSIRDRAVLGPWLHGVARRVAVRARVNARRRRARERRGSRWPPVRIAARAGRRRPSYGRSSTRKSRRLAGDIPARRWCSATWRATRTEEAIRLLAPVGTVKSRLSRAREPLRSRLARRGIVPSAGLAATLSAEPALAITADLLGSTLRAATRLATGREIAAGIVSAAVAALVEQTSRSMSMNALKFAAAILTGGILATGAGVFAYQARGKKGQRQGRRVDPGGGRDSARQSRSRKTWRGSTAKAKRSLMPPPAEAAPGDANVSSGRGSRNQTVASLAQVPVRRGPRRTSSYCGPATRISPDSMVRPAPPVLGVSGRWRPERDLSDAKAKPGSRPWRTTSRCWKEVEKRGQAREQGRPRGGPRTIRTRGRELWLAQAQAGERSPQSLDPAPSGRPRPGTRRPAPAPTPGRGPSSPGSRRPIAMSFPNPTPLEDVLKYIQQATAGPDGNGIPDLRRSREPGRATTMTRLPS